MLERVLRAHEGRAMVIAERIVDIYRRDRQRRVPPLQTQPPFIGDRAKQGARRHACSGPSTAPPHYAKHRSIGGICCLAYGRKQNIPLSVMPGLDPGIHLKVIH